MIGIYKITNLVNGLVYIGQSKDVDNRLKSHASCSTNTHLRNSILRYGKDNFSFECIEECEISALNERERYYITLYKSNQPEYGYNFTSGGEREPGWYHSDETKHKLSLQAKQRASNPDYCNPAQHSRLIHKGAVTSRASGTKLTTMLNDGWELGPSKEFVQAGSAKRRGENNGVFGKGYLFSGELNHFYGKHHTEESKKKISQSRKGKNVGEDHPFYGKHHTEETKQKNSIAHRKYIFVQIDLSTGKEINRFSTIQDVCEYISSNNLSKAKESSIAYRIYQTICGKQTNAYGYGWVGEKCNDYPEGEQGRG